MADEPHYNPIFERFVDPNSPEVGQLPGMVAYGLYKLAKREWAADVWEREGRKPTEAELDAYIRTWTNSRIRGNQEQAESVLGTFATSIIEDASPQIREDALRGTFWQSVGTSMFAALLYTVLLLAIVIVAQVAGVDIVSIFDSLRQAGQ